MSSLLTTKPQTKLKARGNEFLVWKLNYCRHDGEKIYCNILKRPTRVLQMVELFEKGYGKDAASIAHDAISQAKDSRTDVVLVDTAGRMQDNEPLMKALAKVIYC